MCWEKAIDTTRFKAVQTYDADEGIDDQWLKPFVIGEYAGWQMEMEIFYIRGDRAIEISSVFDTPASDPRILQNV